MMIRMAWFVLGVYQKGYNVDYDISINFLSLLNILVMKDFNGLIGDGFMEELGLS